MGGRLRPVEHLVAPEVERSLRALGLGDRDAAAVRLARRYAAVIDGAAVLAADLVDVAGDAAGDEQLHRQVAALAARVQDAEVLATFGPKLLRVLAELGATPRARGASSAGGGGGVAGGGGGALQGIRNARAG